MKINLAIIQKLAPSPNIINFSANLMKHLIIDSNQQIPQKRTYHIVPCSLQPTIQKIPDCQVSNYFQSTITHQINEQTKQEQLVGTIQGHKMVGIKYENFDNLYNCICYRKQQSEDIEMVAIEKIQNLTEWRKDIQWKHNQGHIGSTFLYCQLMEHLQAPIDFETLQKSQEKKQIIQIN